MSKEEIIAGNKLIADFMDYPENGLKNKDPYYYAMRHCYENNLMRYHSDWGWLMGVIEKISTFPLLNHDDTPCTDPQDVCYPRTFGMPTEDGKNVMVRLNANTVHQAPTLLEAAYLAVVDFIQFENERNNKP